MMIFWDLLRRSEMGDGEMGRWVALTTQQTERSQPSPAIDAGEGYLLRRGLHFAGEDTHAKGLPCF